MTLKASDLSEYVIYRCDEINKQITPLANMKILYLCYGWYAAFYDKELFSDNIEAWEYGPVIREVYFKYLKYRKGIIIKYDKKVANKIKSKLIKNDALELINSVIENYSKLSDLQLSTICHQKDTPWYYVDMLIKNKSHETIPFGMIRDYYKLLRIGIDNTENS